MRRPLALLPTLLALLVLPGNAALAGDPITLTLDPTTTAGFTLKSTLHTVHGSLPFHHGWIRFDPESGEAEGEVVLDARGALTGNNARDRKMHEEVLRSEEHPTIDFTPQLVEGFDPGGGSEQDIRLSGTVRLLGRPHEVTLSARVTRGGDHLDGSASLTVPFVEWGLEDPSVFVLRTAKEVAVTLELHGTLGS